jgi:hypothetical protein
MTYTAGARQRPLSKQLYDQPFLGNSYVNNGRCQAVAAIFTPVTIEERHFLRGPRDTVIMNSVFGAIRAEKL